MPGPAGPPRAGRLRGPWERAGAGAPRFPSGRGVVPPLFRTRCVRFGEAETPVGARWIRNSSTSRFRGAAEERLEGWPTRVGSRRLGVPAGLRGVGSRQGAPFSGPFTPRKASSGSSETNARKFRSDRPQPQINPQRTRDPPTPEEAPHPRRKGGEGRSAKLGYPQL